MCLSSYPLFAFAVAKGRGIPSWLAFVSLGKRKPFIAVIKLLFKCLARGVSYFPYPRLLPVTCPPHQLLLQIRVRVGISIHITVRITPCIHLRQGIPFISSRIRPAAGREKKEGDIAGRLDRMSGIRCHWHCHNPMCSVSRSSHLVAATS